jgi:serine/threonine protein kinase/Flp pilus assembly protein TadD
VRASLPRKSSQPRAGEHVSATPPTVVSSTEDQDKVRESDWPQVPGYEVLGVLGRGGMGVVYKARQTTLNRVVALKMILAGAHASEEHRARLHTEATTVARLHHAGIVQVYEVGEHQGLPFFSMEFCAGGSLADRLNGTPLPARRAARIVEALARAVQVAHDIHVVHRDLKPANVLLLEPSTGSPTLDGLRVTDFGLAKLLDAKGRTLSNTILGTPSYMAPEQAAGRHKETRPATDVWALGAILYECLTGRPPFKGETYLETLEQVCGQEPVPPAQLLPKVPLDLNTICLKCLQKEADKRYANAGELADDLRRFLAGEPVRARPVRFWERGLKWVRRNPTVAALIVVSLVALASLVGCALLYLEHRARAAETSLSEERRKQEEEKKSRLFKVERLIREAQTARAGKNWEQARISLTDALARMEANDPSFDDPRSEAERLLRECEHHLAQAKAQQEARGSSEKFLQRRADALFHAILAAGADRDVNLRVTREAAVEALRLCGVSPDAGGPFVAEIADPERTEMLHGCYELLLILAEVEALSAEDSKGPGLDGALRILDRAAALGPPHPTQAYHLRRARYLEQLGRAAEAKAEREQAAARPPLTALDHYLLGIERYKEGKIDEAARCFERVLAIQPDHFWAQYYVAVANLLLKRPEEARLALSVCLSQRPTVGWVYMLRGYAHGQLGKFAEGTKDFQKALELTPERDAQAVLYMNRALLWSQQERSDQAIADLKVALTLKPGEYLPHLLLAQVYRDRKNWGEAISQLDQAIALRSKKGQGRELAQDYVRRGRLFCQLMKYREALADWERAAELDKADSMACFLLATVHLKRGESKETLLALDEYRKRGGRPTAEFYRCRGRAHFSLDNHPAAIEDLNQTLQLEPEDAATRSARGWAHLASRAHQVALRDFNEAILRRPKDGNAYSGRAYARLNLGNLDGAVEDIETALKLGPEKARLFQDAARILAQVSARMRPNTPATAQQIARLQGRAVELLRQALRLLPPDQRERVLADRTLEPLCRLPNFPRPE